MGKKIFSKQNLFLGIGVLCLLLVGLIIHLLGTSNSAKNQAALGFVSGYKESNVPIKNVPNFEAIKQKYGLSLSADQEKYLDQNKFLLLPVDNTKLAAAGVSFDYMLDNFDTTGGSGSIYNRKPEDTKLVTPDIVLHAYHKYFELTLEELEQGDLNLTLSNFLTALHDNLSKTAKVNTGDLKTHYQTLDAQIITAKVLLENNNGPKPDSFDSPEQETAFIEKDKTVDTADNAKKNLTKYALSLTPDLIQKVQYNIDKIYAADKTDQDPLFAEYTDNLTTDYTQFTPRSHYTKTSALRSYFRTMMYLGRSTYFLAKDAGIIDSNLLTEQFKVKSSGGVIPQELWNKIMTVTGFYAGQSDDLTFTEWQNFLADSLGTQNRDAKTLSSGNTINQLAQNLSKLRLPKILSDIVVDPNIASKNKSDLLRESLGFKIFGQRFTFDAWVLNDLTAGEEKTNPKLPSTPSALFIPAAFGDLNAKKYSGEFLKKDGFTDNEVSGFNTKLAQKQTDLNKVSQGDWLTSLGTSWLYVLGSLTHSYGAGYPAYMQVASFLDKQIQTFLGSYTELKHDTLLYAKQSYAEKGGGGPDETIPPVVKGFVEPNLDFWKRFNTLVDHTQDMFVKNNLFTDHPALARLQNFKDITHFYEDIANKEMRGAAISDDEYEKLRTTGLSFMAKPFTSEDPDLDSGKTALIADVHTDAVKSQILYEANGQPYLMLAIVGNENSPRVTSGLVYNHYEFTNPLGKRLTDEDWKTSVYDKKDQLPPKNFWYNSLLTK